MLRQSHPAEQICVPRIAVEPVVLGRTFDKQQVVLVTGFGEPIKSFLLVTQLCIGRRDPWRIVVLARCLIDFRLLLQDALSTRGYIGLSQGGRNLRLAVHRQV